MALPIKLFPVGKTGTIYRPLKFFKYWAISINEILSGERLDDEKFKTKAEENISTALENSTFDLKEKKMVFEKKWLNDHILELILEILLMFSFAVLSAIFYKELCIVLSIVCLIWAFWINNRRAAYVEKHIYGNKKTYVESDTEKKSE